MKTSADTTQYTIYLVNNSSSTQVFWCFLAPPDELVNNPAVFANSSTSLAVASFSPGLNTFTIPVQYVLGAGASNNAVGLGIQINSTVTNNVDLGQTWDANYATVPPNMGPAMARDSASAPATAVAIKSNAFNQAVNEAAGWFSNMSYGIQTAQGFSGMSWSPSPQQTRTLTPKLQFYVAVGSFGSNSLAAWSDVSNDSAQVSVPNDFKFNKTTVTLTATGGWVVTPGAPSAADSASGKSAAVYSLIQSHRLLSEAHAGLVGIVSPAGDRQASDYDSPQLAEATTQADKIVSVMWDTKALASTADDTHLIGTLTVATALTAAFSVFVLGGVRFSITSAPVGGTTVSFSYSGSRSVAAIKSLFEAGKALLFS